MAGNLAMIAILLVSETLSLQQPEPLMLTMEAGTSTSTEYGDDTSNTQDDLGSSSAIVKIDLPHKSIIENKNQLLGYKFFINPERGNIPNKLQQGKLIDSYLKYQPNYLYVNGISPMKKNEKETTLKENPNVPQRYSVSGVNIEEHEKNDVKAIDGKSRWINFKNEHNEDPQGHFQFYRTLEFTNDPSSDYYEDNYFEHRNQIKRQVSPHYYSLSHYPSNLQHGDKTYNNIPVENDHISFNNSSLTRSLQQRQILPSIVSNPYHNYYTQTPQQVHTQTDYGIENSNAYYMPYKNYQRLPYEIPVEYSQILPATIQQNLNSQIYLSPNAQSKIVDNVNIPQEVNIWPVEVQDKIISDAMRTGYKPQKKAYNKYGDLNLFESEVPDLKVSEKSSIVMEENVPGIESYINYKIEPSEINSVATQQKILQNINPTVSHGTLYPELFNVQNNEDSLSYSSHPDTQFLKKWIENYPKGGNLFPTRKIDSVPISTVNLNSDGSKMVQISESMYPIDIQEAIIPQKLSKTFSDHFLRTPKAAGYKSIADDVEEKGSEKHTQGKVDLFPRLQETIGNSIYSSLNNTYPLLSESRNQNMFATNGAYMFPLPIVTHQTTVSSPHEPNYSPNKIIPAVKPSWYVPNNYIDKLAAKQQSTKQPAIPKELHISSMYTEEISETTMVTKATESPQEIITNQKSHKVTVPPGAKNVVIKLPNGHDLIIDIAQTEENSDSNIHPSYVLNLKTDRTDSYKRSFPFNDPAMSSGENVTSNSGESSDNVQVLHPKLTTLENTHANETLFKSDNTATSSSSSVFSVTSIADSSDITLSPTASVGTTTSPISNSQYFEKGSYSPGYETVTASSNLDMNLDDGRERDNTVVYDPNNNILMISLFKDRHEPNALSRNEENSKASIKENTIQATSPLPTEIEGFSVGLVDTENEDYSNDDTIGFEEISSHNREDFPIRGLDMDLPILVASANNPELVTFERNGRFFRFPESSNCKCECI